MSKENKTSAQTHTQTQKKKKKKVLERGRIERLVKSGRNKSIKW